MRRTSPWLYSANILAALALFFSVGGDAISQAAAKKVGALISGRSLKAATITSREVKDRSLTSRDFRKGALPAGKPGLPGAPGAAGRPGRDGAPGTLFQADGDPAAATLRTLGIGARQAAAGNDPRLSDSRVPSGAAGGALTGSYPNPTLKPGSVGQSAMAALPAWRTATLTSPWTSFDPSTPGASYYKDHFGVVHVRGHVKGTVTPATIFVLPTGFRPTTPHWFAVPSKSDLGYLNGVVEVAANGDVVALAGAVEHFALDGISFRTD